MTQPNYELLKDAYAIIDGIPAEIFDLDTIVTRQGAAPDCGTIACAAGFLAMHPDFIARGLAIKNSVLFYKGSHWYYDDAMANIFGISAEEAVSIFGWRGASPYDKSTESLNDKQLWQHRVRAFLKEKGQL